MTRADALSTILMRVINRHLSLEFEVRALREILHDKGLVSHQEFQAAEEAGRRFEQELHARRGQTQDELLRELLRKFQGPRQ